jgi:hypothetical protein
MLLLLEELTTTGKAAMARRQEMLKRVKIDAQSF